jgi:hypothetical protein
MKRHLIGLVHNYGKFVAEQKTLSTTTNKFVTGTENLIKLPVNVSKLR